MVARRRASAGVAGYAVRAGRTRARAARRRRSACTAPPSTTQPGTAASGSRSRPSPTGTARVHAVLVAIRPADRPPFEEAELRVLGALADAWAPFIHQLALQQETEQILERHAPRRRPVPPGGDRAPRAARPARRCRARPPRLGPRRVLARRGVRDRRRRVRRRRARPQVVGGAAVVRVTGRTDVTTYEGGTITALAVGPIRP